MKSTDATFKLWCNIQTNSTCNAFTAWALYSNTNFSWGKQQQYTSPVGYSTYLNRQNDKHFVQHWSLYEVNEASNDFVNWNPTEYKIWCWYPALFGNWKIMGRKDRPHECWSFNQSGSWRMHGDVCDVWVTATVNHLLCSLRELSYKWIKTGQGCKLILPPICPFADLQYQRLWVVRIHCLYICDNVYVQCKVPHTHKANLFKTRATLSDSAVRWDRAAAKQFIDKQ